MKLEEMCKTVDEGRNRVMLEIFRPPSQILTKHPLDECIMES